MVYSVKIVLGGGDPSVLISVYKTAIVYTEECVNR